MTARRFILTDGRAAGGDFDAASVLCFEDTMRDAVRSARSFGEACIFSFTEGPPKDNRSHFTIENVKLERTIRS